MTQTRTGRPNGWNRYRFAFAFLCAAVALPLLGSCVIVAHRVDANMNSVVEHEPYPVSEAVAELHARLVIADLHSDSLLWRRNFLKRNEHGHVDLPRLREGNVALQVLTTVTKSPPGQNYESNTAEGDRLTLLTWVNGWPWSTHGSLKARALHQARRLEKFEAKSRGALKIIRTSGDLEQLLEGREQGGSTVGALLGIEGGHCLEGDLGNLQVMYDAGFRMMGLTHFFDNELGGSAHGTSKDGLSDFGKVVVLEMARRSMIVDLAHCSPQMVDDVLKMSRRPVVVSHTGVKGTYDSPRNLSDDHIRRIAKAGGIIGIGYWDGAVGEPTIEAIVRAMRYTVDLVGADHVALGSDYDGSTQVPFDTSELAALTQGLTDAGFSAEEIRRIMGGNAIEFLLANLPER